MCSEGIPWLRLWCFGTYEDLRKQRPHGKSKWCFGAENGSCLACKSEELESFQEMVTISLSSAQATNQD